MCAGVRPIILRASVPTAWIRSVRSSIATTDGSKRTIPSPRRKTTVFAVPRSTASSVRLRRPCPSHRPPVDAIAARDRTRAPPSRPDVHHCARDRGRGQATGGGRRRSGRGRQRGALREAWIDEGPRRRRADAGDRDPRRGPRALERGRIHRRRLGEATAARARHRQHADRPARDGDVARRRGREPPVRRPRRSRPAHVGARCDDRPLGRRHDLERDRLRLRLASARARLPGRRHRGGRPARRVPRRRLLPRLRARPDLRLHPRRRARRRRDRVRGHRRRRDPVVARRVRRPRAAGLRARVARVPPRRAGARRTRRADPPGGGPGGGGPGGRPRDGRAAHLARARARARPGARAPHRRAAAEPARSATLAVVLFVPAIFTRSAVTALPYITFAALALSAQNPPLDAARLDIMVPLLWGRAEGVRTLLRTGAQALAPLVFGFVADYVFGGGRSGLQWTFAVMLLPLAGSAYFLYRGLATYPRDVATAAAGAGAGSDAPDEW